MSNKNKIAEFLEKADEADRYADDAKDSVNQASWHKIAARYRDLAMIVESAGRLLKIRRYFRR